ncbi:expressed unknown protein [Seminavis robusta]|uniref:Uncharacterized protein n=1 Tax=Seminavis robusta TaxID=568900 RepID=A0A9N8EMV1_9STRA|nr:expressed unknown protein [Seminavis robusta]|eukprot:Sro1251_g256200.1 n/a (117) ;mRNA; f:26812-27162
MELDETDSDDGVINVLDEMEAILERHAGGKTSDTLCNDGRNDSGTHFPPRTPFVERGTGSSNPSPADSTSSGTSSNICSTVASGVPPNQQVETPQRLRKDLDGLSLAQTGPVEKTG